MLVDPRMEVQQNLRRLNQAALQLLRKAGLSPSPYEGLYVLQLAQWGLEQGLQAPGQSSNLELAIGQLRGQPPDLVMEWLVNNPEGGKPEEQQANLNQFLRNAESPESAALYLLEEISSHLSSQLPGFRQAASMGQE
jgi:hypothetical protein